MSFLDLTNVGTGDFEPLPEGSYNVVCDSAEIKQTKTGTGEYINTKFKVVGGEFDGRKLFTMFNIKNPNEKAVQIGMSQLKSFMKASGLESFVLRNVTDLEGMRCSVGVKIKEDSYGKKNNISYYKPSSKEMEASLGALPF